jgi:formate dehydrogenase iron-sulfur subunit
MRKTDVKNSKAILIDVTKCTGCEQCVDACVNENKQDPLIPFTSLKKDGLSGDRFTSIVRIKWNRFAKKSCLHCMEPGCVDACIAGAIKKTDQGPVVYNPDLCIGCRYCMLACPVGIPRYEWDKSIPYIRKCDMCYDRLLDGKVPACAEACPNDVIMFGDRSKLINTAKERIENQPQKYLNHIYGKEEFGGTSVLYITDTELDKLGFQTKIGSHSIADFTWPIISKTPILGLSVAALLTGTHFIINRRIKLQNEKSLEESVENKEQIKGE